MREGTDLSGNLSELSASLRKNAERLLRDVHLAHARLTANLDQATPPGPAEPSLRARDEEEAQAGAEAARDDAPPPGASAAGRGRGRGRRRASTTPEPPDDLDVPEFLPRG